MVETRIAALVEKDIAAYRLLDEYDHGVLARPDGGTPVSPFGAATVDAVVAQLDVRYPNASYVNRESVDRIVAAFEQAMGGEGADASIQRQAAILLHSVVKSTDASMRTAAALFTQFLHDNNALLSADGQELVSDNALVAMTLMVAASDPSEKETVVRLLENMLVPEA